MRILGVVQARMNSSRLPGKVLMDIGGRTMLARVLRRASRANFIDELIVATPNVEIQIEVHSNGFETYSTNKEEDVLGRFQEAFKWFKADAIVRICGDNPLIDPYIIDWTIHKFKQRPKADYARNTFFPLGLGVEVIKTKALEEAWRKTRNAKTDYQRIHVTPYILENPYKFEIWNFSSSERDLANHRWTVDTQEDLDFIRSVYSHLGNSDSFGWQDVLDLVKANPELERINAHIKQKELREC